MNYSELLREVKSVVADASPTILVSIPDMINEAIQLIAEEAYLPSLKTMFTVTTNTSAAYTTVPTAFSGKLTYVGTSDGEIKRYNSVEELIREFPAMDEVGDVEGIALEGTVLWYQKIPSTATTLTCIGYNSPTALSNSTDTPDCIPEYLHRGLIVNKTAMLCYNIIEDGMEAEKVNTVLFENLYQKSVAKLGEWVSKRRVNTVINAWTI